MKTTRVGVDLAKNVFQVHGVDRAERAVWCKRLKRNRWIEEIEQDVEPGAEIGMEAYGGVITGLTLLPADFPKSEPPVDFR